MGITFDNDCRIHRYSRMGAPISQMALPVVSGPFLDLELVFQPAADCHDNERHCSASGLLLQSWSSGPEGSAALIYNWDTGVLEVCKQDRSRFNLRQASSYACLVHALVVV